MKVALIAFLFALPVFAQIQPAPSTSACGPEKASLDVKLDKSQHVLAQPDSGKALIYFIQDIGEQQAGFLFIDAVDSDEARYLIDRYPQSISQPKK